MHYTNPCQLARHLQPSGHTQRALLAIFIEQGSANFVFATCNQDLPADNHAGLFDVHAAIDVYCEFA